MVSPTETVNYDLASEYMIPDEEESNAVATNVENESM